MNCAGGWSGSIARASTGCGGRQQAGRSRQVPAASQPWSAGSTGRRGARCAPARRFRPVPRGRPSGRPACSQAGRPEPTCRRPAFSSPIRPTRGCSKPIGSTRGTARRMASMPSPGSTRSSCSSSNLARWSGRRLGRAVPMQIACSVRSMRSKIRSSRRAPSPRRSSSAQTRLRQAGNHAGQGLRASAMAQGTPAAQRTISGGAIGSIGSLTRPRA